MHAHLAVAARLRAARELLRAAQQLSLLRRLGRRVRCAGLLAVHGVARAPATRISRRPQGRLAQRLVRRDHLAEARGTSSGLVRVRSQAGFSVGRAQRVGTHLPPHAEDPVAVACAVRGRHGL